MAEAQPPPQPQDNPYIPGIEPVIFDNFIGGIDTASSRPGIDDGLMAWCDGFMPIGKNNLRVLPGVGSQIYPTFISGPSPGIVFYDFANIGTSPYCIVVQTDGSIVAINTNTFVKANVAPAGTVKNPSKTNTGIGQWGNQYVLIVTNQTNGYFIWDGTALYQAGTISPIVTVTNSGTGYTSQPTFTITGGSGSGVQLQAVINAGVIENINVLNAGSGYQIGDTPIITISGGGSDSTAQATAVVSPLGGVSSIAVTAGGGQYSGSAYSILTGGGGTGARTALSGSNGTIVSITVLNPGYGFTSPPAVSVFDPGSGHGFTGIAYLGFGQISSVNIVNGGSGYTTVPSVSVVGDGTGAVLEAVISGGQVTGVNVINAGLGYTHAQIVFTGGNNAASATLGIMPYGVQGSALETYQSRVWITNGSLLQFTTPGSVSDFATSDGGGAVPSTDSFLRVSYTQPRQTNGFLYLIADSSINYISGVQTAGNPPTTTYTNQNADPEIGTPYSATVDVFSRNILLANDFGVHVSYGGAVTKISEVLDGVYNTVPGFAGLQPSAAKAIIFGKKIWMLLLPIINPVTGTMENKLFMWNGKVWFSSSQDVNLVYVQHQEINSILTAYGTDGNAIYPLFQQPSTGFKKTVQSKLWDRPGGYYTVSASNRLAGLAYYYSQAGGTLTINIDNEDSSAPYQITGTPGVVTWLNNANASVSWLNNSSIVITWTNGAGTGVFVIEPIAVAQQGALVGFTVTTNAADMAIISLSVFAEFWQNKL